MFAVRLLTRGVPITVVSELLGHSNIQITVKRYGRFASDAKVKWDAVRVLDQPWTAAASGALRSAARQTGKLDGDQVEFDPVSRGCLN